MAIWCHASPPDVWGRRAKRTAAARRACISNRQRGPERAGPLAIIFQLFQLNFDCEAVSGSALKAEPAAVKSTEEVVAQWRPWPGCTQGPVAAGPPVRNPGNVLNVMGPCHELALLKQATRPFPRVRGLLLHDSEMRDLILWPVMVKQTDVSMHNNGQKITERNPLPLLSVCLSGGG